VGLSVVVAARALFLSTFFVMRLWIRSLLPRDAEDKAGKQRGMEWEG